MPDAAEPRPEHAAASPSPATTRPGAGQIALSVGLALSGFLLTAGMVHAAIRDPLHLHADARSEKLAMLEDWRGKVFSAAFGTSHIHNGFDPRVFDAVLAGTPMATRSANLAIEGGSQTEQFVMADRFVRQLESPAQAGAAPQPCLVVLELNAGTNFTNDHLVHPRAINIYDWQTAHLTDNFVVPTMGRTQRYGRQGYAWAAMGLHYMNVGMLSSTIFSAPLSAEKMTDQTADDRRGLLALPFHATYQPRLQQIIAATPKQPAVQPGELLPGNSDVVERLRADASVKNVSFVYVVMPRLDDLSSQTNYPDHITVAGPAGPMDVPILNLGHAADHPEVYNPALWYDDAHLTGQGAALVTKLLAEQLKQWYANHGEAPKCG